MEQEIPLFSRIDTLGQKMPPLLRMPSKFFVVPLLIFYACISSAEVNGVQKISGPMVSGGDVKPEPAISSDGAFAVYISDQDIDTVTELYSVAIDSAERTKLNPDYDMSQDVKSFQISPDGRRVIYLAKQDNSYSELYSIPIEGGMATKLNIPVDSNGIRYFWISPDSTKVLYSAVPANVTDIGRLFATPIEGGASIPMNDEVITSIGHTEIKSDSLRVLYWGDTPLGLNLFNVNINDGSVVKLNPSVTGGQYARQFSISENGNYLVYALTTGLNNLQKTDLFSVPIGGGVHTKLNGELNVRYLNAPLITDDSETVVFWLEYTGSSIGYNYLTNHIYAVDIEGGGLIKIDTDNVNPNLSVQTTSIRISNSHVLYVEQNPENPNSTHPRKEQLFSAPLSGEERVTLTRSGLFYFRNIMFSQDGSTAYFTYEKRGAGRQIYRALIPGGVPKAITTNFIRGRSVFSFSLSPDQGKVIYLAGEDRALELYVAKVNGEDSGRISGDLVRNGNVAVNGHAVSPDGSYVIYTADQEVDYRQELYLASTKPSKSDEIEQICFPIKGLNESVAVSCLDFVN